MWIPAAGPAFRRRGSWCLWIPTWRQPASIDLAFWTRNAPPLRRTSRTLCGRPPTSPSTLRKTRSSTISPSRGLASIRGRGMRFSAAIEKTGRDEGNSASRGRGPADSCRRLQKESGGYNRPVLIDIEGSLVLISTGREQGGTGQ